MLSAISLLARIMLSALISLSELYPRVGITLSALVSLSEMTKGVFTNPNGQSIQTWVTNLQSKFEGNPTINESRIVVLPK